MKANRCFARRRSARRLSFGAAFPAHAGKKDNSIRLAANQVPESLDAYFNNVRIGVILAHHIWDHLVSRDPKTNEYKPSLATAWNWVDDQTLEFDLRKGVKFHNGERVRRRRCGLHAELRLQAGEQVDTQQNVNWIDEAVKVDDYKVRDQDEEAVPGGARVPRRPGRHLSERVLREGRPEGHEREAGRQRPVQGRRARARPA